MHRESFIFFSGIQAITEQKIWQQGIKNWEEYLNNPVQGIGIAKKTQHKLQLQKIQQAITQENEFALQKLIPKQQHWRLYNLLKNDAIYLDIETTYRNDITVIGIYTGEQQIFLVQGYNLNKENFLNLIQQYKLILTFNGRSFDIPVIERYFKIKIQKPHIDLMHVCRKVGLVGGLKKIEKDIGIKRPAEVTAVGGDDAVMLWMLYKQTGNKKFLTSLLAYNEQDCINLQTLAEHAIPKLWQKVRKEYIAPK